MISQRVLVAMRISLKVQGHLKEETDPEADSTIWAFEIPGPDASCTVNLSLGFIKEHPELFTIDKQYIEINNKDGFLRRREDGKE